MQRKSNNSFSRRPPITQIISYSLVTLETFVFYISQQANISCSSTRIVMITLFTASLALTIYFTCLVSCTDPTDPLVRSPEMKDQIQNKDRDKSFLYCTRCKSIVQYNSRHCKICERCVDNFDHHCIWINNCIGQTNYKSFMGMVTSVFINFGFFLITTVIIWVQEDWLTFKSSMIMIWSVSFLLLIFEILVFTLLILHLYLMVKGITTYEWLVTKKLNEVKPETSIDNFKLRELQKKKKDKGERNDSSVGVNGNYDDHLTQHQNKVIHSLKENDQEIPSHGDLNLVNHHKNNQDRNQQNIKIENILDQNVQAEISDTQTEIDLYFRKNKSFSLLLGKMQIEDSLENINYKSSKHCLKREKDRPLFKQKKQIK